jgi:4-amino-4-deoxy-L-arabinose transferase-like glycosyltransferase
MTDLPQPVTKGGIFLVFIVALLPRLYAVDTFLTIDEVKWAEGAAQFLLALHAGDLSQTYWHFFPGVTITWGSALALWGLCLPAPDLAACANLRVENLAESIGWLRLSPMLLTSLGVTGVYVLGRKLFGHRLALLTALLLAVDPFFVAHSRILNGDTGAAILIFLSLLAFLIYWREMSVNSRANSARPGLRNPGQNRGFSPNEVWPPLRAEAVSVIRPSLILSGLLAGLALLTKLPSPLIIAFVGGLGLVAMILAWCKEGGAALHRWFVALLIWGGIALLIFVALWPAMWVAPLETLRLMYIDAFKFGGIGEGHATFYLGQTVTDPGPWFYPYAIAFRLTPVVIVGLLMTIGWLLLPVAYIVFRTASLTLRHWPDRFTHYVSRFTLHASRITLHAARLTFSNSRLVTITLIMLAFIIFIILFANASPKKLDRYVIAVIPALVFLAALGLVKVEQWCLRPSAPSPLCPPTLLHALLAGTVALQLLFTILAAPYYLTYYNPLLGGVKGAVRQVPVGWGEGLEQAATYLNNLPDAESLAVSSWYSDIFHPYFVGQRASFSDDGRAQLAADYVVFYINQIQRQKPYPGLVDYFRAKEPVFVVAVKPTGGVTNSAETEKSNHHVSWVEVYRAPAAQSASGAPKIEGVAQLLAYKVAGSRVAGSKVTGSRVAGSKVTDDIPELPSADQVSVTLFLRVLGPLPENTTFGVALKGGNLWGNWALTEVKGEWQEGNIVEWHGILTLPADMPPGEYRLWAAFQFADGSVIAEFPMSDKDPVISLE